MGRIVKNTVFKSGSYALGVPSGNTAARPSNPVVGQTRWNTDLGRLEFYASTSITGSAGWFPIAQTGNVYAATDNFTGATGISNFNMAYSYAAGEEARALVHVGTVYQIPGTNYSFYGNTMIHFSSEPSNGSAITVIHGYATTRANIA